MFIDRLMNQGSVPVLEKLLDFTATREGVLAEDVANVDTPGYRTKDLSLTKFQSLMRRKLSVRDASAPGATSFDDVQVSAEESGGLLFHDGNNRSMEQLMSDNAKNTLMHNMAIELLKKQYSEMEMALREKVS